MTRILLLLSLLQLPATAIPNGSSFFRYQRSVTPAAPGQTCAILDAATFAHAEPFLKDLRLTSTTAGTSSEVPFVITLSEAQQTESEAARVLNLGMRGNVLSFDLQMPARPYTEVNLDLAGQNFLATANVTGLSELNSHAGTSLGTFNLFDLTAQHLSRSTVIHLQESTFPYLHITLTASPEGRRATFSLSPLLLRGATVPPSRVDQTLFTVAAQTSAFTQRDHSSVATLDLPERVPIERVSFTLAPGFHANFSRDVVVSSHAQGAPAGSGDSVQGTIQRIDLVRSAREIQDRQLSIPATLGANLQSPATVEVAVNNGDDPPIPLTSVVLEMRQRALCFQAVGGAQYTLHYGDPKLEAPVYDLARTYTPSAHSAIAQLGPEQPDPAFHPRPDARPYTERHPHLLWIALLAVVCVLALVAFRSSHPRHHPHP